MRVLQVHKFFYPHAGSETVLFHTRRLLEDRGHDVLDFAMQDPRNLASQQSRFFAPHRDYNDASRPLAGRVRDAGASVYSLAARRQLGALLDAERPDVAHLHIISHQLTSSVVDELAGRGIPMVMTHHDYKIGCPAYVLYRDGAPCRLCTTGAVEHVLQHRCLKGSFGGSLLAAAEARLTRARGTWDKIDIHIGPSSFAADVAIEAGIPPGRVRVIPNFLPADEIVQIRTGLSAEPRFFLAGRLERVKGVGELLAAFDGAPPELGTLVIAGAGGELEKDVAQAANAPNIEYLGRISRAQVSAQLRQSRAAVVPSLWDENNPMSLLEARAAGVPVVATSVGGLPEMVTDGVDGLIVPPGDPAALRDAIRVLATDARLAAKMADAGRDRLMRDNSPNVHYPRLLGAYEDAITNRAIRAGA